MILLGALIYVFIFFIEELAVQLEEIFSIFPMQGFYNKTYENSHETIGWYPNEDKNNVERGTSVTVDASDIGTGGWSMSEVGVKMVQGTHSPIPICL